jgi:4-hydroxy-tetrahydrodipicolinate synthase
LNAHKEQEFMSPERFGLSCAIATPFENGGRIGIAKLTRHAQWCLAEGCDGVTLFGTTGEGFSLSLSERGEVLEAFRRAGFDMRRQVCAGVMATSVDDAAAQAANALNANVKALLLAPPFYLKGVGDDGVFAWYSALFEALGDKARDVILYHLPYHTGVAITLDLIDRLRAAFPSVIGGVKDSAGDWHHTEQLLARHGDIAILVGDERHLARAVRQGGQGSICGIANAEAGLLRPMAHAGREEPRINGLVDIVLKFPVLPAVKGLVARRTGDMGWLDVRPPLMPLTAMQFKALAEQYDGILGVRAQRV